MLFHYNGHGVPKPTSNGELWVFNSSYTQYIPLSVYDLQVLVDCHSIRRTMSTSDSSDNDESHRNRIVRMTSILTFNFLVLIFLQSF